MGEGIDLLLVNAPPDLGKKDFDLAFPFQRRLNFGLLSLATVAEELGLAVSLFDPQIDPSRDAREWLRQTIQRLQPRVIGISCISGFSYPTALAFAAVSRSMMRHVPIIIGGKDHVGQLGEIVLRDSADIDVVVKGEAESILPLLLRALLEGASLDTIPNLVVRKSDRSIHHTALDLKAAQSPWVPLNYNLLPDSLGFAPSIEISRGCSFGCEFCVSARTRIRKASPTQIVAEAARLIRHWRNDDLRIYFETPMFIMTDREIEELAAERSRQGLRFTWRTETRVDYLSPARLELLYKAGLRVIDLGLESGDPEVLRKMGKTSRPEQYLQNAHRILKGAHDLGIMIKVNVLFYAGETPATVLTTLDYLESARSWINSLSAYPLMLYPGAKLEGTIAEVLRQSGGSFVESQQWRQRHLTPVNPSSDLTYERASSLGLAFAKSFQTLEDFYYQKTYGYFSPHISNDAFKESAIAYGVSKLPFTLSRGECDGTRRSLAASLRSH